jgi:D-alanine-D-alanine ligase-like ATP-grasp enzyme
MAALAPWLKKSLGPALVARAAEADGATAEWLNSYMVMLRKDGVEVLFWDARGVDLAPGARIAGRKDLTRKFLERAGVPVPAGMPVRTADEAVAFWRKQGLPVVLKPMSGTKGRDVTVGADREAAVRRAFDRVRGRVLVEEMVRGEEFRALVLGGRTLAVLGRDAPNVVGDGRATIEDLVKAKNRIRAKNPHLASRLIRTDAEAVRHLEKQGMTLADVPGAGEKVYLRGVANFSAGGDSIDVTDTVAPSVKAIAARAVAAIPGLELAGVDLILDAADPARAVVLEVNSNPGLGGHHFPMIGAPRDVAAAVWGHAFRRQAAWARCRDVQD